MVKEQIKDKGIIHQDILAAFMDVKRHLFVSKDLRDKAYDSIQLPIGNGETMSRPYFIAIMALVMAPSKEKKILDVGTGSGYLASILSRMVKTVYTIEISAEFSKKAQKLIKKLNYNNIKFKIGNGYNGWEEHAPFDGIITTFTDDHIPNPLKQQLKVGGRMILPISYSSVVQELVLIEKQKDGTFKKTNILAVPDRFKPIIREKNGNQRNDKNLK
jgi:protein-L-isoaspartate(D-aspartate) O-methyltransferase